MTTLLSGTLEDLLRRGANVSIDAQTSGVLAFSFPNLAQLAKSTGAMLTLRNASTILAPTLAQIASLGGNNVTFEF